jgi:hypothetical protein
MKMVHPLTQAVYEAEADGSVCVTETDGSKGWFSPTGEHLRGEVLAADPHILDWVGGPQAKRANSRLRFKRETTPASERT